MFDRQGWLVTRYNSTNTPNLSYIDHFLAKKHEPRPEPNGRTLGGFFIKKKTVRQTFYKKVSRVFMDHEALFRGHFFSSIPPRTPYGSKKGHMGVRSKLPRIWPLNPKIDRSVFRQANARTQLSARQMTQKRPFFTLFWGVRNPKISPFSYVCEAIILCYRVSFYTL